MTLAELIEFSETVEAEFQRGSEEHKLLFQVFQVVEQLAYRRGHGLLFEVKLTQEKVPGEKPAREIRNPMKIYDAGVVDYLHSIRHSENAFIIQPDGTISHKNVSLPVDLDAHEERYGITDLAEVLGYASDPDGVGGRAIAAMCGSEARGEGSAVVSLHRCNPGIRAEKSYWRVGERKYSNIRGPALYKEERCAPDNVVELRPAQPAVAREVEAYAPPLEDRAMGM